MLSRIAEALYWIGRYVERFDDTARILDAHLQLVAEGTAETATATYGALMGLMGQEMPVCPDVRHEALTRLAFDQDAPAAIAGALAAARENARRARQTVSAEMWESLNTAWHTLPEKIDHGRGDVFGYLYWARERAAVVFGVADATMLREDSWHFLKLGQSLERADMTARLVASGAGAPGRAIWRTVLRACGAHEAYLHVHGASVGEDQAAEFMVLDPLFPRSVVTALRTAELAITRLDPTGPRIGFSDKALRVLGAVRSHLEYERPELIAENLEDEMRTVQIACAEAGENLREKYFPYRPATTWIGGRR